MGQRPTNAEMYHKMANPDPRRVGMEGLGKRNPYYPIHEQTRQVDGHELRRRARRAYGNRVLAHTKSWVGLIHQAEEHPQVIFYYGKGDQKMECHADITTAVHPVTRQIHVVDMVFLCPKCGGTLGIDGIGTGGEQQIYVHWDKPLRQSQIDAQFRPLVTVSGWFGCDYLEGERSSTGHINKGRAGVGVARCNWRGGIVNGVCFDHSFTRGIRAA